MAAYMVVRFYAGDRDPEVIATGLTLEEASAHCSDPETSSVSATGEEALRRTAEYGPWFEGFRDEDGYLD